MTEHNKPVREFSHTLGLVKSVVNHSEEKLPAIKASNCQFSISFFGNISESADIWDLIVESAQFADQQGFEALWLPERHFSAFGGFSPNPALLAAAVARQTKRLRLCAGSCVLPLHHPARVAEEWALVDQLSGGRTGVAFASGWHVHDFIFQPGTVLTKEKSGMEKGIEQNPTICGKAKAVTFEDGRNNPVEIRTFPQPVQAEIPFWIAALGNPETFAHAGRINAGILTNFIDQDLEKLSGNIEVYRRARASADLDPNGGKITVLIHTFLSETCQAAIDIARKPLTNYLASSLKLSQKTLNAQAESIELSQEDQDYLLASAVNRYIEKNALIGSPEKALGLINALSQIGVTEIACFIDFGIDASTILKHLPHIAHLKQLHQTQQKSLSRILRQKTCGHRLHKLAKCQPQKTKSSWAC
ncbi:MAG: LLM class flavin-dependent oxidoreductase [Limnobacter sp.]|nr:LLM class flavin-dependent oxidoreductase [Limnobacter sp.]